MSKPPKVCCHASKPPKPSNSPPPRGSPPLCSILKHVLHPLLTTFRTALLLTSFPGKQHVKSCPNVGRKKPIKKNHIKEFGGQDAPEASQGQTRDVPGTPGTFGPDLCANQYYRDRMSPGQTGHITGQMGRVPGTDGTHTRGCPAKILYVYWFFFFPYSECWEASHP